jgi:hypothetical protein
MIPSLQRAPLAAEFVVRSDSLTSIQEHQELVFQQEVDQSFND